jgi:hypothetical protein
MVLITTKDGEKLVFFFFWVPMEVAKLQSTWGVSHCGLVIYIKKYLKAKEELLKPKYFTMQKHNLQKIL